MWENIAISDRLQMTIRRMRTAFWITKIIDKHSEYVILIAFTLQQCLYKRVSVLRYAYIACLVVCFLLANSSAYEFRR
jgi:hypothetical protein